MGNVDFGIVYPIIIVPIAIVGAANAYNLLAGLNGLEAGMGALILSALGYLAWMQGQLWLVVLAAISVSALAAFLIFNWYPARIFPGDSLTYLIGALIAIMAIMGNMERAALILFTPYLIEGVIKAKQRFNGECFGIPQKNGTLLSPKNAESLTHYVMRFARTERGTVITLFCIELVLISIVLWI